MPNITTTATTTRTKGIVSCVVEEGSPTSQLSQRNVLAGNNTQAATLGNKDLLQSCHKPRSKSTDIRWLLLTIPALLIASYAAYFIPGSTPGDKKVRERILKDPISWVHILGGMVALGSGPFQFIESVRKQKPYLHRISGRVYAIAVILSAFSGFDVSFRSLAHPIGQWGFALLAFSWLATCTMMLSTIWQGNVGEHRKWAIRNYSLTYAAVMLRWQLPLLISLGITVPMGLTITSLGCWVPNLIYAELHLKQNRRHKSIRKS